MKRARTPEPPVCPSLLKPRAGRPPRRSGKRPANDELRRKEAEQYNKICEAHIEIERITQQREISERSRRVSENKCMDMAATIQDMQQTNGESEARACAAEFQQSLLKIAIDALNATVSAGGERPRYINSYPVRGYDVLFPYTPNKML